MKSKNLRRKLTKSNIFSTFYYNLKNMLIDSIRTIFIRFLMPQILNNDQKRSVTQNYCKPINIIFLTSSSLKNILHVPKLDTNIIPINQITTLKKGITYFPTNNIFHNRVMWTVTIGSFNEKKISLEALRKYEQIQEINYLFLSLHKIFLLLQMRSRIIHFFPRHPIHL